jgi:DNA-binding transcriptional MocR family regulator
MPDYRTLADSVASEIASGQLPPGIRLPPQREFAFQRGIAVSTATRVYAELVRRGLVSGEVGRGTYVRALMSPRAAAFAEPRAIGVDLELNYPLLPQQGAEMAESLAAVLRQGGLGEAFRPVGTAATSAAREIAAKFLTTNGWAPNPDALLFTGGGRQAVAASISALARAGERIGVEATTYPAVIGIAARLGVDVVPVALDNEGLRPDALLDAHRAAPLKAVYVQPTLHNPLGTTMGQTRRREIARVLEETGIIAVEDRIYSFLADEEPLASLAPENTILVDSLSKRLAPGLTIGFVVAPFHLIDRIAGAIRSGGWSAAGLPLSASLQLMADGTLSRLVVAKRTDAAERQEIARDALAGLDVKADRRAYHLWLKLPEGWRADAYAAAAAREGIAITPASAFAVTPGHAPNAVRLALAPPTQEELARALRTLRRLADMQQREHRVE